MEKICLALSRLSASFDGERVSYGDFEKRMSRVMDRVHSGAELDFLNFTRDMQNAMRHENGRKEKVKI